MDINLNSITFCLGVDTVGKNPPLELNSPANNTEKFKENGWRRNSGGRYAALCYRKTTAVDLTPATGGTETEIGMEETEGAGERHRGKGEDKWREEDSAEEGQNRERMWRLQLWA